MTLMEIMERRGLKGEGDIEEWKNVGRDQRGEKEGEKDERRNGKRRESRRREKEEGGGKE